MIRNTDSRALGIARSKLPYVLALLILGGACALRLYKIDEHSYWLDEFLALEKSAGNSQLHRSLPTDQFFTPQRPTEIASATVPQIWSTLSTDNHPPLYFVTLHFWTGMFGSSELATRSMSVIFSLNAMAFVFDSVRRFHGTAPAIWTLLALAVATPQITYAQEARMYAMAMAILSAIAWVIVRIETDLRVTPSRAILLTTLSLAAILTHYLTAIPIVAMATYCIFRLHRHQRTRILVALAGSLMLFAILWGSTVVQQISKTGSRLTFSNTTDGGAIVPAIQRLGDLPVRHLVNPTRDDSTLAAFSIAVLLLPLALARTQKRLWLWLLPFIATVGAIWITDLVRGTWLLGLLRYSVLVAPALIILICACTAHLTSPLLRHAIPAAICISAMLGLGDAYSRFKPDTRSAAHWLDQRIRPGDVVVFAYHPDFDWVSATKYLEFSHYLSAMPDRVLILTRPADAEVLVDLADEPGIWLILPPGAEVASYFPDAIEDHNSVVDREADESE